jgi:hypothetical protein
MVMIGTATCGVFGVTYLGVFAGKEAECESKGGVLLEGAQFCTKRNPASNSTVQSAADDSLNPTQAPTFAPTPSLTNPPKPDFTENAAALKAKIASSTVVENALLQSSSPTVVPTPYPTEKVCPIFFLFAFLTLASVP